jgi:hypothetical protein
VTLGVGISDSLFEHALSIAGYDRSIEQAALVQVREKQLERMRRGSCGPARDQDGDGCHSHVQAAHG